MLAVSQLVNIFYGPLTYTNCSLTEGKDLEMMLTEKHSLWLSGPSVSCSKNFYGRVLSLARWKREFKVEFVQVYLEQNLQMCISLVIDFFFVALVIDLVAPLDVSFLFPFNGPPAHETPLYIFCFLLLNGEKISCG